LPHLAVQITKLVAQISFGLEALNVDLWAGVGALLIVVSFGNLKPVLVNWMVLFLLSSLF